MATATTTFSRERIDVCREALLVMKRSDPTDKAAKIRDLTRHSHWPELIRAHAELNRLERPKEDADLVRELGSTTSWSETIASIANVMVLDGFNSVHNPYEGIVGQLPVPNFRENKLAAVTEPPVLERLQRGNTPKLAHFAGTVEGIQAMRLAAKFTIDEQDQLDNQSLDLVFQFQRELGRAARRATLNLIASTINENPTLNSDSTAVFHENHNNLGSAVLTNGSLDAAVQAVLGQTTLGDDEQIAHVDAVPKYCLVPPALYGDARALARAIALQDGSDIEVRCDSRLAAAGCVDPRTGTVRAGNDGAWYVFAPGSQTPGLMVGGLNGSMQPKVTPFNLGPGQWGVGLAMKLDIGVAWAGYYGSYKSVA